MMQYGEYPMEVPSRKFPAGILIAVLVVVLLAGAALLILKPVPTKEIIVPRELAANAVLASYVDDNFNYAAQPNSEYTEGKGLYLYIEAINFAQRNLSVYVTEDVVVRDSDNNVTFSKDAFGIVYQKFPSSINLVRFRNVIPTVEWKSGTYTATVTVNDRLAGKSTSNILEFKIDEKPTDVIQKTVDLKNIISTNIAETKLIKQVTVWNPQGMIIPELSFNQTIIGDLSKVDLSSVLAQVKIPDRFDAGTYTAEVKYTNIQNGKSVSVKDTITVTKQLSISQFVFASSINANYNFVAQPDSTFANGSLVYVYMKLIDFAQPLVNGNYSIKFTQDAAVLDVNGNVLFSKDNFVNVNNLDTVKRDSYNIKNSFSTGGLNSGKYFFRATVTDLNNNQKTTREEPFWIR